MSSDEIKLEAAYEHLMEENIKSQLEKNGTMAVLRSEMHVKVLQMMRGQQDVIRKQSLMGGSANLSEDQSLIKLINQLVMEFFHWFGYRHTLETFRMETGESVANRSEMEQSLFITPDSKDIPLLAQLIMRDWKLSPDNVVGKRVVQLPDPGNSMSQRCRKLREELEAQRAQKEIKQEKLVQYNRKLIKNDPLKRPITVKMTKTPPRSFKKESSKVCLDSSESDILESDYSEEESEDSDAYKDIPDRQFYIEDLPPEGKYAPGRGEEGPYDAKQRQADSLFEQYKRGISADNIPSSSKKPTTPNRPRNLPTEGSDSWNESSLRGKNKVSQWNYPRKIQHRGKNGIKSEDEPLLAVAKPKCPDTQIGEINLDSDDSYDE
ncbi:uncharacterized protein LOC108037055 [Drosophila rhopaloa]|uniref:Uncharacterized protein LOC108037055 n=1 Tax=Drosophila rhopaloa TaxID=1041015 RepID=A0A6P4DUG9_DRORH|nr:uncharacterized protein LOC108037055 [Drosophila rhopaloa]